MTVWSTPVTLFGVPLISPEPVLARPVTLTVLSLVHVYVVTASMPLLVVSTIAVIASSEHTVCVTGVATPTGSDLTITVAVNVLPTHPAALVGVIVYMTVWSTPVTLFGVPLISPEPVLARPVTLTVLSLVHVYVVTASMPLLVVSTIAVIASSEHTVCVTGVATPTGSDLTITVAVNVLPTHPAALVGVIVYMTVWSTPVTLFGVPLISPEPVLARPVTLTVLSLVHVYVVTASMPLLVVSTIAVIASSEHTVCVTGVAKPKGIAVIVIICCLDATLPHSSVNVQVLITVPTDAQSDAPEVLSECKILITVEQLSDTLVTLPVMEIGIS